MQFKQGCDKETYVGSRSLNAIRTERYDCDRLIAEGYIAYLWCESEVKILSNDYTDPNTNPKTSRRYHNKQR